MGRELGNYRVECWGRVIWISTLNVFILGDELDAVVHKTCC